METKTAMTNLEKISRDCLRDGTRNGYEQCANYLDAMARAWNQGANVSHEVVSKAFHEAARSIRELKESI
jgi:hypothetical protein